MNALRFGLVLVLVAVAATVLLWWLGYWVIAFAVGIAVIAIGAIVYISARAGRRHGHLTT